MSNISTISMAKLADTLKQDEGFRQFVYDDSNDTPIRKSSTVNGIPTIGYGRNVQDNGVSQDEAEYLLKNDITKCISDIAMYLPWSKQIGEVRLCALVQLAFNLGVNRLMQFKNTLGYMEQGKWDLAGPELLNSEAAVQLPIRYKKIANMVVTGQW